tara:strand:- start:1294 stop:1758 length:465 start_codon:yes stop_codon:yes gene_type:complete
MIDTDKYEGHTPAPWNVSRGQRNTVLIESETLGCSDCESADIYTYANTGGKEIQFPNSVEPAPFTLQEEKDWRMGYQMYCPSCDLLDWATPIDATQNDTDLELIADAPLLLAEVLRLQKEHDTVRGWFLDIDNYMMEYHYDMWQEIRKEIGLDD